MHYYNARYYDDHLGTFISPDTLVPDVGHVFDYNRFMYTRGNPLKYTDPSGHCSSEGSISDGHRDECWKYVNDIANVWEDTDYWNQRWVSKDTFLENVAPYASNDTDYIKGELWRYWQSDEYKEWRANMPTPPVHATSVSADLGDYFAVTAGYGPLRIGIIRDDFSNWYLQGAIGLVSPIGFSRGDLINMETGADIDMLNVSIAEKEAMAKEILTGPSGEVGGAVPIFIGASLSRGWKAPHHVTMAADISSPGVSVVPWSYTILVWD